MKLIILALIIAVFLESTLTTLPLVLLIILFGAVITKQNEMFALAFLTGLFLDIFSFRTIGISSFYFVGFVLGVFLYQKKFEIETLHFVLLSSLIGSFFYLLIQGSSHIILESLISCLIISVAFFAYGQNRPAIR